MQNPLEKFLLNLVEKIQTEKEYKEIVNNSQSVDVNKDVFAGFIEGISKTIRENVQIPSLSVKEPELSEPDPLEKFLGTLKDKLKEVPPKKTETTVTLVSSVPVENEQPPKQEGDAFEGFVNNLTDIIEKEKAKPRKKKIFTDEDNEEIKGNKPFEEPVNDYVKILSSNKKKDKDKKEEEDDEEDELKSFVSSYVSKELANFQKEMADKMDATEDEWNKKLGSLAGGGGSVAVQYADGGVMNGNLSVNNLYPNNGLGEIGTPSNRWDRIYANQIDSLSSNIVVELSGFFVNGDFTVNGGISALGGNSTQWNSVYTSFSSNSSKYESVYTTVNSNSSKYESNYSSFNSNSASYNSVFTTVKTLSTQWKEIVNAKDYGAIGNGVADDTSALQTALNSISGGVVKLYIPKGLYYTTSELKIGSYSYIYGDGIGSTVIKLSAGTSASQNVLTNDQNTKSYLTNLGNRNIVIKDLEVDGNVQRFPGNYSPGSSTRGCGIGLANVDTAILENVYVHDCCNHCIDIAASQNSVTLNPLDYVPGPSQNITIRNASVSGSGDDCITTHFSKNILIENPYITGSLGTLIPTNSNGIEIDDGSQDVTILGGYVKNCMRGLEIKGHEFAPAARRIRVYGLTVENCMRNFDIRHIGFDSGDSATAFDVQLYNCTSISPVSSNNDPDTSPRALKISNYSGVTVKDFTCVGLCDTTNLVAIQEGARNVWINGLSFQSISGSRTGITDAFVKVGSDAIKNLVFENLRFWNCVGLPFYAIGSVSGIRIDGVDAYSDLTPAPDFVINFSWAPDTVPYTIKNVTIQGYLSAYSLGTSNADYPAARNVEIFESIVPANASKAVTVAKYGWREGTGQGLNAGVGTRIDFTGNIYTGVSARRDIPVAFISSEKINATDTDLSSSLNFGTADNNSTAASKKMTILPSGNVGINVTNPSARLTVSGTISSNNTITSLNGNSNQWNSAYTSLNSNSGKYESVYSTTNSNSASWNSVYTSTKDNSGSWNSNYTTTNTNSAKWESVYTTTNSNSAYWQSTSLAFAASDETVNVTAGNQKILFTSPNNFVLTKVKGGMNSPPTGSSLVFTLSSQTNNNTAATVTIPAGSLVADSSALTYQINENDRMCINITQVGSTTPGVGLKVYLIGRLS